MNMPRWLRRLIVGVAAALATAVAAMALFFVFLHTGPGERWTSGKLEETVAGLELDGYHLGWPFRMRADYMRLADAQGTWLQATAPELVWHPLRLWRRVLDIDRLVAARVEVLRLPQPPETEQGGGMPRLSGTLRLEELRLPVVLAAPVLGEQVNLELSGTAIMATGGGNVDISLRIQGGGFARVNGTAGTDYLDLRWYLQVPDLSRWQRLAGRPLAGSVTGAGVVVGRLPSPEISGSLDLTRGHADSLGWDHLGLSGQAIPEPRLLRLALRVDAEAPRWQGKALPQSSISAWAIGDLSPELGRIRLGHAQLVTPMATVEGSAVLDQWGRRSFLRLRAQATPPGMADRVTARGEFSGDLTVPRLAGRLDVTADRFASGIPVVDRGLGPRPRARIGLSVDGERIRLAPSRLDGARSTLWLQGGVAPRLDLWARLALPQVSVLADDLAGEAQAFAHVTGRPATPRASGVARLDGVATAGIPPASGTVAFDLPDPVRPRGHLSGAFDIAGTPLSASTRLDRGAGIQLNDLRVESGQSLIAGDVEIAHGAKGRLTGSIPQLQQWERVVGFPLSGRVEADAVLDPARGQSVRLTLHGGEVVVAGFGLGNVEAVASGQAGRVTIETLDLSAEGTPVRLLDPALVSWRGNTVTLPPATVAVGSGQTIISAQLNGQQVTAQARLAALPLSIVHADTPGVVNGTVNADGPLAAPRIRFALTGHEIGLAGATQAGLGKLTARLDGSWSDRRLRGRAEVTDGASVRAEAEASLPLPGDGAIDGKVRARGDAGKLTDALPMAGHVFAGRLDAAATISGTMAAPRVNGRAELTNGRYENLDSGTVISPLHAVAVLDGDRIRLSADGNDTAKGTIRLQGGAGLDGAYGADIALDRFTALRRADVEGTTSGTLRLTGTGTDGRLEGRLAVPRAEVDVGHIRGGGPVSLEVIEINRPGASNDAKAKPDAPGQPPLELALAVAVEVEHAFVRGRGLDSEWQGQVNVGGTTAAPSLTGQLTAARGQLDALGKVFKLTPDSTVTFQGGDTIDPSLAVTAEASAADITAQVEVTGTAKAPEIAFTSTPPLPQDEVLARLLFGREAGKLSAFQQVQLAQMAASGLTGGGGGFDPVGDLRGFLGLDVLGVGSETNRQGGTGGPTLSAGKYIGPDTFVRVEQGTAGLGRVTVEQGLGGGFSVESSLGEQSGGGVGLTWRKDY